MSLIKIALVDADFFFSYFGSDQYTEHAKRLFNKIIQKEITIEVASELFDDLINGYRADGFPLEDICDIIEAIKSTNLKVIPSTPTIVLEAMRWYIKHKGSRKLHYFDSFHVATAIHSNHKNLITTDSYIHKIAEEAKINVIHLRTF